MDNTIVRTAAELEKKYNLSKYAKQLPNIETNNTKIIKLQQELTNILKTIIINLGDTLQESVSLWFYEGTPTTSNEPYISWNDPTEHYDDLYYDQTSGYVYKYTSNGWIRQNDINLVSALALTNAELDVTLDHERKVYLTQPTPPYSSGDWWILEDGTLMICQLGKPSGDYEEQDFVVSTMYTSTIATKENETMKVIRGKVVTIDTNTYKKTEIQKIIDGTGVDGVKVSAVVSTSGTFDENGMHYEKTGAYTKSTINEKGVEVDKSINNTELFFAGFDENINQTIVRTDNINVKNYLTIEDSTRIQKYGNGGGLFIL